MERKWRLVVVGNGMAGINTVEQLLKLTDRYDITVIGEEPHPNYNRILLSYVLEGSKKLDDIVLNPYSWYEEAGITLLAGEKGERIDTERRVVLTDKGREVPYDRVIVATGSTPFRLPVPGADKEGVVGFRSIEDCDRMIAAAGTYKTAAVIGGGLLGLEAAKGLVQLGMDVTVVHLPDYVMERQLDMTAARLLEQELERQGIRFALGKQTVEITGGERVEGLRFIDGTELQAEFVVMAVGIRPNVGIGQASGLNVNRGIVVDDWMRTSAEDVYAVGECTEHRGICYGLVAPLFEQGAVLAKTLAGVETKPYEGSVCSTKLKVSGVDVFSTGIFLETPECSTLTFHDGWKRTYRKIVLRDNIIVGAVLFGDTDDAAKLERLVKQGAAMTDELYQELTGTGGCCGSKANAAAELADDDIVCGCNGVTKKMILDAIANNGLTTLDEVKACTGASRSCGGCKPLVEQLLQHALGDGFEAGAVKQGICGCTEHSRDEIVAAIREQGLHTVHEVMAALEWKQPEGCSKCRPALNYYLGMIWPESYRDDKASRFVNERMNANIQKDGTYTVVPRMYGGMTSPEELKKIADVSLQYNVQLVKMTGGQRIDLIGVKKEDVPKVWEALDMPSGYAYAKSLRTVKTCVGSRYCRFGTQDSLAMGALLERKFERIDYPAKFKMAVNGCPRNCAESCTKDIGIVGNDGGWEIYIGGNGGIKPRLADLLCKVKTDEELVEMTAAAIQYYRETANYLERTSEWVERIGLDAIRRTVVEDSEERKRLVERINIALAQAEDPWKQVLDQPDLRSKLFEAVTLEQ
ncbi:nitrite reductase large subunit NirB [Paenibacillus melissococcoides]|uniref:Nitrite reductase large subunit NirB n=1 Tax=Paenibacillus melissococcoides TaxID=2912268 RepID=A0ABN8U3A1_9BACL|nr:MULTISPECIES: nitrite reductase large subunit NirB [Paenibacillus]MEB9892020.1 nitrite reductase large subunit NirB [Bacillus cereus]CAH8245446.1 nitrite reductase large subunit NirB [Paenibacillus melissococcoides]CAH8710970.1 nitrite reductase large subunit NirB [Paenibacillus melissococcoides]CAH8711764.1 nitrite reductase large subunit NirB [Paenibacillus melissococcoides]GIO78775.1 nitrite reductase [NAD(P)H] [Paenibacillus dendritiformis]